MLILCPRYIPEKFENESFTPALWGKPEQTLDCFNLEQKVQANMPHLQSRTIICSPRGSSVRGNGKASPSAHARCGRVAVQAIIHLRKRQQANRVKHEKRIKMVLFDYVAPLEQSLPLVAKKFNYDNWREFNLYVSGEKERTRARHNAHTHAIARNRTHTAHAPSHSKSVVAGADWPITQLPHAALKLDQSLLSQGILPDTVFALRKPDEPVDQVMHPIKQRITISLNQQNQGTHHRTHATHAH